VLVFLWIAVAVLTVIAFFAILFTGRYPPFALADVPDYPARLKVQQWPTAP
jgi:hypothetical protein